jgi:uncharacterized DUF497 family protein
MFEWDADKEARNLHKHGIRFDFASRVFDDPHWIGIDVSRAQDGEPRHKAIGVIDDTLFAVIFTMRGNARRIISARRTNTKEDRQYADHSQDAG